MKNNLKLFVFTIILISCQTSGIDISYKIIRNREMNILPTKPVTEFNRSLDSVYSSFFNYRKDVIHTSIKNKKIRDFVLKESILWIEIAGSFSYSGVVITKDSTYFFLNQEKDFVGKDIKSYNENNSLYTLFKRDSVYIYKSMNRGYPLDSTDLSRSPFYISHYRDGKLEQLVINDTILYKKRKESKMVVDLNKLAWRREGGELYIDDRKTGNVQCGDVRYQNCVRNEEGSIVNCDTL